MFKEQIVLDIGLILMAYYTCITISYHLTVKLKVKQYLYTPWRRLGGEEV
jgi:hypothetical protein